ncbi:COG4705 family protein [Microbulbifer hainanensis]|uniref:COG4705 family protein n=1 Tax=Microbulbifer hainanensis TaxID=2735675 RepID=UPI001865B094|nr:hypothetical protein [Microbulbifer hainanensis]
MKTEVLSVNPAESLTASKVPEVVAGFWLIKILATTLGETGGDSISMTLHAGYAAASLIFLLFFIAALSFQLRSRRFTPSIYWFAVVTTTTLGTTVSDFLDRSLGLGYIHSSMILTVLLVSVLAAWYWVRGRIACQDIADIRDESFYWVAILIANTLGTAVGDYASDDLGLGFGGGSLLFGGLLLTVAIFYFATNVPRARLFWVAFVLTRPLGATLGDILTKSREDGGLAVGTIETSLFILSSMVLAILLVGEFSRLRKSYS